MKQAGALLVAALSIVLAAGTAAADGSLLEKYDLDAPPVFDGMAAAGGRLYLCARDGDIMCFGRK